MKDLWGAILALLVSFFFIKCSDDDALSHTCFLDEDRKVIGTFNQVEGLVLAPDPDKCPTLYTMTGGPDLPGRNLNLLAPCGLPIGFEQDSLQIIYSGFLFETFELEDICAQKFEITSIALKP